MKVKVTLAGAQTGAASDDIQITADATATVGDVAKSLAQSDRRQGRHSTKEALTLRLLDDSGQGRAVPADRTLLESGITSGSTIDIVTARQAVAERGAQTIVAVLRVISGPDEGKEFPLPAGPASIGRSPENDVVLTDPMVSKQHCRVVIGTKVELVDAGSANGVVVGGVRTSRVALATGEVAELGDTRVSISQVRTSADATSTDVGHVRPPLVLTRPTAHDIELP